MHRAALLAIVTLLPVATACAGAPTARTPAIDRAELVKSATFDHACPTDAIRVLAAEQSSSSPAFLLDVCGKRRTYKRVGMMYFDAG